MDADGSSLRCLLTGCRHSCSASRHYICLLNLKTEFFSSFFSLTHIAQGSWCKGCFFCARSVQSGHVVWLCSDPSGHSVHPWVSLSHGRDGLGSFGFWWWQSMLPPGCKACAGVFLWYRSNHTFKENPRLAVHTWCCLLIFKCSISAQRGDP